MADARDFEGRNVDQALFRAAQELRRSPEDLEYEILEEGAERVVIRVEVNPAAAGEAKPPFIALSSTDSSARKRSGPSSPAHSPAGRGSPPRPERPARGERHSRREDDRRGGAPRPSPSPHREREGADEAEDSWSGEPIYTDLAGMVKALAEGGGLDLSVQVEQEGETERVRIDGPDASRLLENDAEGLAALEHLLSKMALRGLGRRARIRLDSAGFRKRREEEIVQMALRSAEQVKVEGGELSTSPLNPYERRLVHMALKDDPSILTESEGNGFLKRVMIRTRSLPGEA